MLVLEAFLDEATRLRERGLVRYVGVSSHRRSLFVEMMNDPRLELFHVRRAAPLPKRINAAK